jgi:DNA-binding IclR family transcriptional regulator
MVFEVATALPLHRGAAPKLLLAYVEEGECSALLARLLAARDMTRAEARRLAAEPARICERGWCESRAEIKYEVHAVAAPVIEEDEVVAALSIVAPSYRVSRRACLDLVHLVRRAADEISAARMSP